MGERAADLLGCIFDFLDEQENPNENLRHLLQSFCAPELLEGYKCDKCETRGSATKVCVHLFYVF